MINLNQQQQNKLCANTIIYQTDYAMQATGARCYFRISNLQNENHYRNLWKLIRLQNAATDDRNGDWVGTFENVGSTAFITFVLLWKYCIREINYKITLNKAIHASIHQTSTG